MVTTYNEVADELVKEFKNDDPSGDEKNIRRRAYDALNVLTAMDIISKDKKDIQWKGFPSMNGERARRNAASTEQAEAEKARLRTEIAEKKKELSQKESQLEDLTKQFLSLIQLLQRNERDPADADTHRIYLPFVLGKRPPKYTLVCFPCLRALERERVLHAVHGHDCCVFHHCAVGVTDCNVMCSEHGR